MKHIVFLSGAGVSVESGLHTFRDKDGLWESYALEDVASIEGWYRNPKLVLDFYNARRKNVFQAVPNKAHKLIAALEEKYKVSVVTQNIDDLHKRAGSTQIYHLHGQITKKRTIGDPHKLYPYESDIQIGDMGEDGTQFRPHIVWFGEAVPMMDIAIKVVMSADLFIIIGTSLQVYPAAGLIQYIPHGIPVYVIDKQIPAIVKGEIIGIEKNATTGMQELFETLQY